MQTQHLRGSPDNAEPNEFDLVVITPPVLITQPHAAMQNNSAESNATARNRHTTVAAV